MLHRSEKKPRGSFWLSFSKAPLCLHLQAVELIKQLAEANKYQIDSATTENTIKLYQLLRVMPYEGLETMWKQFAGNEEHRRVVTAQTRGVHMFFHVHHWAAFPLNTNY